jgi:hypothetical protein
LDLEGHTLEVSATDECIGVGFGVTPPSLTNITIKNGALINNVAGCILLFRVDQCVVDHVSATAAGLCAFLDESGINNKISHCVFVSGIPASLQGPVGCRGPGLATVELLGCSDLLEDNIITSAGIEAIGAASPGCATTSSGNALRNNVIRANSVISGVTPVSLDQYDV